MIISSLTQRMKRLLLLVHSGDRIMARASYPRRQYANTSDYTPRYQCTVCGSTKRLFVQCVPCLDKFVKANAIVEVSNKVLAAQVGVIK